MMGALQHRTRFKPGFDKRHSDPSKNYGISGGRFVFVVSGPKGAVHFVMGASLYPQSAVNHLIRHCDNDAGQMYQSFAPMGWDVGYHSHTPHFDGQKISTQECEWLDGKPCYSDGSALRADEWMKHFIQLGTDWLWPELEKMYREEFEAGDEEPA